MAVIFEVCSTYAIEYTSAHEGHAVTTAADRIPFRFFVTCLSSSSCVRRRRRRRRRRMVSFQIDFPVRTKKRAKLDLP
jgi:hypothetical protein